MMIYLFCNEGFGKPFLKAAQVLQPIYKARLTVVLSDDERVSGAFFRRGRQYIKRFLKLKARKRKFKEETGMNLLIIRNVNSFFFRSKIKSKDIGFISGFNQIFRQETISKFSHLVNIHPSILPFYRGPVPSYWCIKNDEKKTGYTLHKATEKIDEGDILFQEEVLIGDVRDPEVLDQVVAKKAVPVFLRYLDCVVKGLKWEKKVLDASKVYNHKVNYLSFPKERSNGA